MALRFFADHCVSNLIIESLAAAGHEVLRLKDHRPTESILLGRLKRYLELHAHMEDYRGKLIIVDASRVSVRQ